MSITFAGKPLLLEDPGHEFQTWLDRNLPLEDLRLFGGEPVARACTRNQAKSNASYKVGLPLPNWPAPPRPKINTLWWPTGATRWAVGLFLVDTDTLDAINEKATEVGFDTLEISDGTDTISTTMYMLPPRSVAGTEDKKLWLLPMVDQRYFWQFREADELSVDDDTTWKDLIEQLASSLGVEIAIGDDESVPEGYDKPGPGEWNRIHENAAVLLDAAAWCIGMRVVYQSDETVVLLNSDQSEERLTVNGDGIKPYIVSGGFENFGFCMPGAYPSSTQIIFPKQVGGKPQNYDETYKITLDGSDYGTITQELETIKTFFDSAPAKFYTSEDEDPTNQENLQALAEQITEDFYGYIRTPYDFAYLGLNQDWQMTGFDDYVWFHIGHQLPAELPKASGGEAEPDQGDYACYTRIASLPYDFGVSELLHSSQRDATQTPSAWYQMLGDLDGAVLYAAKANPGTQTTGPGGWPALSDEHSDDPAPDDPEWTVMAIDPTGMIPCWKGDWVQCEPIAFTCPAPYASYAAVQITERASAQLTFWGILTGILYPANATGADLFINGAWVGKSVYDFGLISVGAYLPIGTLFVATYYPEQRRFYATNAPCDSSV